MSEVFTFGQLKKTYEMLKNAYLSYCDEIRRNSTGVDFSASKDRMVVVQTAFHDRDIYKILGINEIETNCKYYSGEHLLFCAVNVKCDNCSDYCPKG